MDVRTCKSCKRIFNYLSGPVICSACADKLEEKFKEVKDYIREHPGAPLQKVSDDNEVSVKQLKNWVREERLKFDDDSPVGIECMNCGAMIKYGKYCETCKGKMINTLSRSDKKVRWKPDAVFGYLMICNKADYKRGCVVHSLFSFHRHKKLFIYTRLCYNKNNIAVKRDETKRGLTV